MTHKETLQELVNTINKLQMPVENNLIFPWKAELLLVEVNDMVHASFFIRDYKNNIIIREHGQYKDEELTCKAIYNSVIGMIINSSLMYLSSTRQN